MITPGFLAKIRAMWSTTVEAMWAAFAFFLDLVSHAGPSHTTVVLVLLIGLAIATHTGMQGHLNRTLEEDAEARINPLILEFRYSMAGFALRFLRFFAMLPGRIFKAVVQSFQDTEDGDEAEEAEEEEPPPLLVPSLGPSALWAALICAGIALFVLLFDPLIRWHIDAPHHFPSWQYLLLGHRPELGPHLPLGQNPWAATIIITGFWLVLWSTTARIVRLCCWSHMGRNIIDAAGDMDTLSSWREYFGVSDLAQRNEAYDTWAKWLPIVAAPLLVVAFATMSGEPYRPDMVGFSVALVVWIAWLVHLNLAGVYRPVQPRAPEPDEPADAVAPGWGDVLADLQRNHGVQPPELDRRPREIEPLAYSAHSLDNSRLISPLLADLLPDPHRLTAMQYDVLSHLSRESFVHLDPPANTRSLELEGQRDGDVPQLRHRNQIVIAPEGSGKTTLATLACFNAALTHASSSMIVVRNRQRAQKLTKRLRSLVTPSPLRWNLRIRRIGGDLVEDLAEGIVPDILVCDLQSLVTGLLDDIETHEPFLKHLGLIVVDDIETFCGPVETHAQLAFRRLQLRLKELRNADEIGEEQEPIFLLLASETMDELEAWARSLCGIDAVPRRFASQKATWGRERAQKARRNVEEGPASELQTSQRDVETRDGRKRRQLVYQLNAFAGEDRNPLEIADLIKACEAQAVPWHYRPCGDGRRLLGRSALPLRDEPQSYVESPLQAAVIFLDGHAADVERELARLGRAGARFTSRRPAPPSQVEKNESADEESADKQALPEEAPADEIEPIALITRVDRDERMLLDTARDTVDRASGLEDLVESLPRPFLRPPSGHLKQRHLTSELTQHWTEIADLLDVFGNDVAPLLQRLTRKKAILCEPRTVLDEELRDYDSHVFLRGIQSELRPGKSNGDDALLPARVDQVEVSSRRHVAVREHSTMVELSRVDAESARYRFYPGRIFETSRGRHVVVDYAGEGNEGFHVGDVIAEPFLGPEITSARRETDLQLVARESEPLMAEPVYLGAEPMGLGLFPVHCRIRHLATFRLAPHSAEIRQRIYASESERRQEAVLRTQALALYPQIEHGKDNDAPVLSVGGARQLAAALRAVTPLLYRGADEAIGIALSADGDLSDIERFLEPTEGVFFYDLHHRGNGAARAIERDGVDALLRLAQHLLSIIDAPRRLLAMHDECVDLMDEDAGATSRENAREWLSSRLGGSP